MVWRQLTSYPVRRAACTLQTIGCILPVRRLHQVADPSSGRTGDRMDGSRSGHPTVRLTACRWCKAQPCGELQVVARVSGLELLLVDLIGLVLGAKPGGNGFEAIHSRARDGPFRLPYYGTPHGLIRLCLPLAVPPQHASHLRRFTNRRRAPGLRLMVDVAQSGW